MGCSQRKVKQQISNADDSGPKRQKYIALAHFKSEPTNKIANDATEQTPYVKTRASTFKEDGDVDDELKTE